MFRHGGMDDFQYSSDIFDFHVSKFTAQHSIEGKTILELGPGDSAATGLLSATLGAKSILVDAGAFAITDIEFYRRLNEFLKSKKMPSI